MQPCPLTQDHAHSGAKAASSQTALPGDLLDQLVIAAFEVDDPADVIGRGGMLFRHDKAPLLGDGLGDLDRQMPGKMLEVVDRVSRHLPGDWLW